MSKKAKTSIKKLKFFQKIFYTGFHIKKVSNTRADRHNNIADYYIFLFVLIPSIFNLSSSL